MPQVDLETLVCLGGSCNDNKISCETISAVESPPQSVWLSKDEEQEWLTNNAFIERKNSEKGQQHSHHQNHHTSSNPGSQRFSLNFKSKASSIIGLPKPQKPSFVDAKNRKKKGDTLLFPKRSGSTGKSSGSVLEPGSPKVSCIGRVRSKRDRRRRRRGTKEKKKTGFLASFRAMFRREKPAGQTGSSVNNNSVDMHDILNRLPASEMDPPRRSVGESGPIGLGGMKRFTSGRKSDSWIDADVARL